MLYRCCFSITMGSRSDVVDEEYMEEVKDNGENET